MSGRGGGALCEGARELGQPWLEPLHVHVSTDTINVHVDDAVLAALAGSASLRLPVQQTHGLRMQSVSAFQLVSAP